MYAKGGSTMSHLVRMARRYLRVRAETEVSDVTTWSTATLPECATLSQPGCPTSPWHSWIGAATKG